MPACRRALKKVCNMDFTQQPAYEATADAAACAAARTKPAHGFRGEHYNQHAAVFARLSWADAAGAVPVGTIEAIYRERNGTWRYRARCPYCKGSHMHGGGTRPIPVFGSRDADCNLGGAYAAVAVEAAE